VLRDPIRDRPASNATPTHRRGLDPRLDRARFRRGEILPDAPGGGGSVKVFRADRDESQILDARAEAPRRFALIARVVFARDTESDGRFASHLKRD
jgi:hypothetical protein